MTRIIKLHRSGFFQIPEKFYLIFPYGFMFVYKSPPYVIRCLLEDTKEFDASSDLLQCLEICCDVDNFKKENNHKLESEAITFLTYPPHMIPLFVMYSKNCYGKSDGFEDKLQKIVNIDLNCVDIYPKGIILNKHNIDNQAVTHYFNFIFKGYQYRNKRLCKKHYKNSSRNLSQNLNLGSKL